MIMVAPCFRGSSKIEGLGVILLVAEDELNNLSLSLFICCFLLPTEQLSKDNL